MAIRGFSPVNVLLWDEDVGEHVERAVGVAALVEPRPGSGERGRVLGARQVEAAVARAAVRGADRPAARLKLSGLEETIGAVAHPLVEIEGAEFDLLGDALAGQGRLSLHEVHTDGYPVVRVGLLPGWLGEYVILGVSGEDAGQERRVVDQAVPHSDRPLPLVVAWADAIHAGRGHIDVQRLSPHPHTAL